MRYPLVQRGLIALVQVLAMGVWFSASAVVPALARQWHMSASAVGWRYAFPALAAGPLTALAALTSLHRTTGPNGPAITITGRTTP